MPSFAEMAKPPELPAHYSRLTQAERRRVREAYVRLQNGLCKFCKKPLETPPKHNRKIAWSKFPPGFLDYPIHLHHDHKTDLTIGAVHAYCNAVLWQYYGE